MASKTPRIDRLEKNLIINGGMHFWQLATTVSSIAHNAYASDLIKYQKVTTGAVNTIAQSTDVPTVAQAGFTIPFSLKVTVGTADASQDAADRVNLKYTVEGYDYAQIHGLKARFQTWIKTNKLGTYGLSFRNSADNRSYVTPITVTSSGAWVKYVVDLTMDSAGTWLFDNSAGLQIDLVLMAGSNSQTGSTNVWQGATAYAPTTQVNFCDSTSNELYWTGLQLIPGEFSSDVEHPFFMAGGNIKGEIDLVQRYLEKTYNMTVLPGTITDVGAVHNVISAFTSGFAVVCHQFKVPKRITPTSSVYNTATGTSSGIRVGTLDEGASILNPGMMSVSASAGGNYSGQTNNYARAHLVSDARF